MSLMSISLPATCGLITEFQCMVEWLSSWHGDPPSSSSPLWASLCLSAYLQAGVQRGDNLVFCPAWSPSKGWVEKVLCCYVCPSFAFRYLEKIYFEVFSRLCPQVGNSLAGVPERRKQESEVRVGFSPGHQEPFRRLIGICKWRLRTRQTTQQVITAKLT